MLEKLSPISRLVLAKRFVPRKNQRGLDENKLEKRRIVPKKRPSLKKNINRI